MNQEQKMPIVFVAGPFRADTAWEVEQNVRKAEECALEIWKMGCVAVCPHTNSRFFQGTAPDGIFLKGYKELLTKCDTVFLVVGWEDSFGTREEIELARSQDIPVFASFGHLKLWIEKEGEG